MMLRLTGAGPLLRDTTRSMIMPAPTVMLLTRSMITKAPVARFLRARVELEVEGEGALLLDADGAPMLARITRKSASHLQLRPGLRVFAQVKSVAILD